jgi:hypothetical protein
MFTSSVHKRNADPVKNSTLKESLEWSHRALDYTFSRLKGNEISRKKTPFLHQVFYSKTSDLIGQFASPSIFGLAPVRLNRFPATSERLRSP